MVPLVTVFLILGYVLGVNGQNENCSKPSNLYANMSVTKINIVYSSMFTVSLVLNIPAVLLTYQFFKRAVSTEYSDGIYLIISLVLLLLSFIESFQWIFLSSSETGCTVLAAFREYGMVSLLVIITCTAIHLLLLVKQPKWLMVIDEIKRRRHRKLLKMYFLVTFLVPLLFVPWPFLTQGYGRSYFVCWIISNQCHEYPHGIEQFLLWHIGAILVWAFTTLVIAVVVHNMGCCSIKNLTTNFATLLSMMVLLLICILTNLANFVVYYSSIDNPKVYAALLYPVAVCTALPAIIASIFLMVRAYVRKQQTVARMNHAMVHYNERLPLIA
eukprot:Em0006g625a